MCYTNSTVRLCALAVAMAMVCGGADWRLSQLNRKVWQIEDGLPHNYVTAVASDERGYLLLGTQAGVARFDGLRFTPFEHLGGMWIYSLLNASDGTLWVGSYRSGLHAIRRGQVRSWSAAGTVFSLLEDRAHRIWLVTPEGLLRMEGSSPRMMVQGTNVDGYAWQSMAEDDVGSVWFAAREGLFRARTPIRLSGVQGLPVTVAFAKAQQYLGTSTGLYRLRCARDACEGSAIPGVLGPVVGIRTSSDGALWAATWGNGIYRVEDGRVEHISTREGLADDFVRVLNEDGERNMWVGTRSGGLTRFRKTLLKPVGIPEGLGGNYASAVIGDGADGLWLGTWRSGLFHWRNGVVTPQPMPQQPLGLLINTLALDADRTLWIGAFHGLWRLRAGGGAVERVPLPPGGDLITHVLAAGDRTLWVARERGGIMAFPLGAPFLDGETVTALLEDGGGALWIGTANGLWRISAGPDRRMEKLLAGAFTAFAEDGQGRVWTAAEGGRIQVFDRGKPAPVRVAGLPAASVYMMAADGRSGLWFGTGRGLAHASLANPGEGLDAIPYGVSDGMRTIECRVGAFPSTWKRPDGSIWLPTAKGFVEIGAAPAQRPGPPHPWIEGLRVDGALLPAGAPIRLSPGVHELAASFTAIRLGSAERVQFRYRMRGLDHDQGWVDAGSERIARYSHLRPGRFEVLVSARDPGGAWSEAVSSAAIEQLPFVYQTLWFRVCVGAALAALIVLLYRLRVHAVRRRYADVLEERGRIAREWHDTLLAGLSAVTWQLGVAADQCRETPAAASIRSAIGMVRYCRDEARRAIGDLRNDHSAAEPAIASLADSLRQAVRQQTEGTALRSRVEVEGKIPACSGELQSDLLRICQEAAANALQHAQASELVVRLDCRLGSISLTVQDDGVGMDSASLEHPPHGHYGLLGMRERAQRAGGQLFLSSQPGRGTVIQAVVPLK
jgi:signal transduction histidine kinase/ligand-binding sensor domain-containing protein